MKGPLDGVKVVDLTGLLPGPLCSMYLGDMGAEVIKIENPRVGDGTRYMGLKMKGESQDEDYEGESGMYLMLNRNKKSVTLNLKRPLGREVLLKLLEDADILVEGFRPGAMTGMGIGYEDLKEKFPRLIYCGISGYGDGGPYRDLAGHDGNYISYSGLLGVTGNADGTPVLPGVQIADVAGGTQTALVSILGALYAREKTGKGQFLDIGMMDGAFSLLTMHVGDHLSGRAELGPGKMPLNGMLPNYNVYETKDGLHVMLGSLEERFFKGFLRQAGHEEFMEGLRIELDNADMVALGPLKEKLVELFKSRTRDEWSAIFSNAESCLSPVNSIPEALEDPQLKARGMVFQMEHPKLGDVTMVGAPFRFSETPCTYRLSPPEYGQHTEEILTELGYGSEDLENLRKNRVIK